MQKIIGACYGRFISGRVVKSLTLIQLMMGCVVTFPRIFFYKLLSLLNFLQKTYFFLESM